jgi:transcriptional regulator with GAF, ATPase, and Fis domain
VRIIAATSRNLEKEVGEGRFRPPPPKTLEEIERAHLDVLKQCSFTITGKGGAAEVLNLPPGTLHNKLKKLGITKTYRPT